MPDNSTWYVMTEIPGLNYKDVRNLYGLNQSKNKLGWAAFRLTQYQNIEKWWEIVCSAYLLISLFANFERTSEKHTTSISGFKVRELFGEHPEWDKGTG